MRGGVATLRETGARAFHRGPPQGRPGAASLQSQNAAQAPGPGARARQSRTFRPRAPLGRAWPPRRGHRPAGSGSGFFTVYSGGAGAGDAFFAPAAPAGAGDGAPGCFAGGGALAAGVGEGDVLGMTTIGGEFLAMNLLFLSIRSPNIPLSASMVAVTLELPVEFASPVQLAIVHAGAAVSLPGATAASNGGGSEAKPGVIFGTAGRRALRPTDLAMAPESSEIAPLPLYAVSAGSDGSDGIRAKPKSPLCMLPIAELELECDDWRPVAVRAVALAAAAADDAPVAAESEAADAEPFLDVASVVESEDAAVPSARDAELEVAGPLTAVELEAEPASEVSRAMDVALALDVLAPTPAGGGGAF